MLKPQDIVILLKMVAKAVLQKEAANEISQNKLANHLCMSVSEVNAGIKRLVLSRLLGPVIEEIERQNKTAFLPIKSVCEECLISGVKYFFPGELGTYTRGIATSYAAPIFKRHILLGDNPILVWPYGEGDQRGLALEPLYRSVPQSVTEYPDPIFYELLVLVDAIRSGRARERDIAIKLLKKKINNEQ